jgi:hypothetical protein
MAEAYLDELEQSCDLFYKKLKKFNDYIKRLETVPENKLTAREKGLVAKFGRKKINPKG